MSTTGELFGMANNEAWSQRAYRREADTHVRDYIRPSVSATTASAIYKRLLQTEDRLIPNHDYGVGSARIDDEILILEGLNRVLLTAEHATDQRRNDDRKEADFGTGALAEVVAQDTNATALIAVGRQTSDANYIEDGPLKNAMADIIKDPNNKAHLALHLLYRGRASDPRDSRGYSVMLGIGNNPSDATMELKDKIVEVGKDLGLRMGVNQPHVIFKDKQLQFKKDGSLKTVTFAAAGPNTTRTFSQATAEGLGKKVFAAIQLEINEVLLVGQETPLGKEGQMDFPTQFDRELGAFIGYHFTKMSTEAAVQL